MKKMDKDKEEFSIKTALAYSFANFADITASQFFSFLLFTFYFVIIGLNVNWITLAFIIWSIWNAINDPILGAISDKTSTKFGKRKPWILLGVGPMCIILFLLWTPPIANDLTAFIYMMIMILLFDLFYTMFSLNQVSLFPEMYPEINQRAKANNIIQVVGILALIFAFISPSFFIPNYNDPQYQANYAVAGLFMAIVTAVSAFIFIRYGLRERKEYSKDSEMAPSFIESLKTSVQNKSFRHYVIANFAVFYMFGMLPMISPLYGRYVLGIESSTLLSLLLGLTFISAAGCMIIWNKVTVKFGVRKGHMMAMGSLIVTLVPFMFISTFFGAIIAYSLTGLGLAGALFFRAVTISAIIDQDELKTGIRREGGYMGINALVIRLATIAIILSISLVFNSVGWTVFVPEDISENTVLGLRALMFIFPSIFLGIGVLSMWGFPITKEKYFEIKEKIDNLHAQKKKKIEEMEE
jgi:GPH family glycoside/pentoside/hexuronide:cation symporter